MLQPVSVGVSTAQPWISIIVPDGAQTRDGHMAISGNISHGHGHRLLLLHGHGHRHGHQLQYGLGLHHGLRWQGMLPH